VCLGGGLQTNLATTAASDLFRHMRNLLTVSDIACGNLEFCIVAEATQDLPKNVMRVPYQLARGIENCGIGIWSLCNNHVMDGGPVGLATTRNFLTERSLAYFGAGDNLADAEKPTIVEVKGRRIAYVGGCDVPRYFASCTAAGIAPLRASSLFRRVEAARKQSDVVVCVLHADLEFSEYPSPARVRLARSLVDHGADLVIQHHPHVCQGIERHGGGVIAYSLGNFVFPVIGNEYLERHPATHWGMILFADIRLVGESKQIDWRVQPVTIGVDHGPHLSDASAEIAQRGVLERVSVALADPVMLRRQWWRRCIKEAKSTVYFLHHHRRRAGLRRMLAEAFRIACDPYERRWIQGLLSGGFLE
jgi:poly-gamma-glutamate synthesis protein (capsule biosynthesis protein)